MVDTWWDHVSNASSPIWPISPLLCIGLIYRVPVSTYENWWHSYGETHCPVIHGCAQASIQTAGIYVIRWLSGSISFVSIYKDIYKIQKWCLKFMMTGTGAWYLWSASHSRITSDDRGSKLKMKYHKIVYQSAYFQNRPTHLCFLVSRYLPIYLSTLIINIKHGKIAKISLPTISKVAVCKSTRRT